MLDWESLKSRSTAVRGTRGTVARESVSHPPPPVILDSRPQLIGLEEDKVIPVVFLGGPICAKKTAKNEMVW